MKFQTESDNLIGIFQDVNLQSKEVIPESTPVEEQKEIESIKVEEKKDEDEVNEKKIKVERICCKSLLDSLQNHDDIKLKILNILKEKRKNVSSKAIKAKRGMNS
jgi:hypothetical protein